jgi:competence/damage-inducible protein CinA-like protein
MTISNGYPRKIPDRISFNIGELMAIAEIISIGTELLLGDTQDTNTRFIASRLKHNGFDLFRTTTIGDNHNRIAELIQESLTRADIVITTGGLGPTVDDPTREAVSLAMNQKLVFHEYLWQQILARFQSRGFTPSENNRKQAMIPEGAVVLENQYGTAPAFVLPVNNKVIICLPGVPKEMELLMEEKVLPFLKVNFPTNRVLVERVIHTAGIGESTLDSLICEFEKLANPTVGLTAYPGLVDIRIVASAGSIEDATRMVEECHSSIVSLIPDHVFGTDNISLPDVITNSAVSSRRKIEISLAGFPPGFNLGIPDSSQITILQQTAEREMIIEESSLQISEGSHPFSFMLITDNAGKPIELVSRSPGNSKVTKKYLGPPEVTLIWLRNSILCFIWSELKSHHTAEEKHA